MLTDETLGADDLHRAIEENWCEDINGMEITIATMSEEDLDKTITTTGAVYEALLSRRRELEREIRINDRD